MISLKQIRYFIAAAEAGQITEAASHQNISQSAITTAIKSLEEMLDARLFERHSHGITLTYEGKQFLHRARNVLTAVEEAIRFPKEAHRNIAGKMRLACTYTVSGYYIPEYVTRFIRNFPNVELELFEAPRGVIEEGLISGHYDMAVMLTSNLLNQEDIAYETLMKSPRKLWVSSDHKLVQQPTVTLKDIAEEPYVMLTVDEASNTAQKYWNKTPFRPNTIFRTSSVEAVRGLVANGVGVTILSDMVYRPWSLEGHRIEAREISEKIPTMDIGLAWKQEKEFSSVEVAFREFMTQMKVEFD